MKDKEHLSVKPVFNWTDEKIRVHIFTCVLALRLCNLLQKELAELGIQVSVNQLLEDMAKIKRVNTFFGDPNHPEKVDSFTLGNELSQQIERQYKLKEKYS